ncbi:MAG: ZIP family metal transporter [Pseudomonadota bacterium]
MILTYIIASALIGGVISVLLAALIAWRAQPRLIPLFVSYAVGALLGVVFLDVLPHIFESTTDHHKVTGWILAGILGFFALEKMVLWRHSHDHGAEFAAIAEMGAQSATAHTEAPSPVHTHGHSHGDGDKGSESSAWMIIIGDAFHNFTDGLAIAAAFVADVRLGILTSIAIIAHELPQELGDFLVLIHSGFSKQRALFWNMVSSLATLVGAVLAYFMLQAFESYAYIFLCLAASSMIYVAIADLIPGLHRRTSLKDSLAQFALIGLGISSIMLVNIFVGH